MSHEQYIVDLLEDLMNANENKEIEFKSAKGGFPGSFWETYSSFANTEGGIILFGVTEKKGQFSLAPLSEDTVKKFKQEFFNAQNNRQKVSLPLLTDKDIDTINVEDGKILYFVIPRATRQQRPIYIGQDPLTGTYRRNNEGDYICDPMQVTQMFAERDSSLGQIESRVLNNYSWNDIDMNSFRQYRTMFSNLLPSHPWTALDDLQFMQRLGGYRTDRRTGKEGFTMAGILMFGKAEAITDPECAPDFMVDYREIPSDTSELRWVDRLYPDGTWEANLFQFYRLTLPRLQKFLPKPFKLKGDTRIDETPAHVAVREALINCLVHAQYGGSRRINVFKTPKGIRMSNPGTLLVSPSQFYEGGMSETRNPALQRMFGLIGKSDKAGSGVDKILKGWREANWRSPYIEETGRPDKVELFMPMETLIDDDVVAELKTIFGDKLKDVNHNGLIILSTALTDDEVSNTSLQPLIDLHPSDISKLLRELCKRGFLASNGFGKGTTYHLASQDGASDKTGSDKLASDKITSDNGASDNGASDKISDGASSDDASSDGASSDDASSDGASSDGASSDDASSVTSSVTSSDVTSSDVTSSDVSCNKLNSCSSKENNKGEKNLLCKSKSTSYVTSSETTSDKRASDKRASDKRASDIIKNDNSTKNEKIITEIRQFAYTWRKPSEIAQAIGKPTQTMRRRILPWLLQSGILEMEYPDNPTHPAQRYRVAKSSNTKN